MNLRFFSSRHPVWSAGFRPFFILAMFSGLLLPLAWGFVFSGRIALPNDINPMQWHAHEMLFGFAGAVLIGFLLTASKNWVSVRGVHGKWLIILVLLWIFDRVFFYYSSTVEMIVRHLGLSLFILVSGGYVINTLIRHRHKDSFNDNYFFIILLSLILIAKNLLISHEYYQHGIAMTIGLFRLAFAVMFERTITQFMKSTEGTHLYRNKYLDFMIKITVMMSIFQSFYSSLVATLVLSFAAALLFVRWIIWRPDLGFKKFGNATMYLGYLGLVLHFVFTALQISNVWSYGTSALHIFTLLCLGVVIPSMIVRIAQGHTGRKPQFGLWDQISIILIFVSALVRLLLPIFVPSIYTTWIMLAGLMWFGSFLILLIRYVPLLLEARVDGKEH